MIKDEFLKKLNRALHPLEQTERSRTVQYYREILEDRLEDGLSEEEAVAEMEPIEEIASGIIEDATARGALKQGRSVTTNVLLILGSPLWLMLVLAGFMVVAAVYMVAWTLIVALFSVVAALGLGVMAGVLSFIFTLGTQPMSALFILGAGVACGGLGIFLFFPALKFSRWLIQASSHIGRSAWARWGRVIHKKEEQV